MPTLRWRETLLGAILLALFCGGWLWTIALVDSVGHQLLISEAEDGADDWVVQMRSHPVVYRKLIGTTPLALDESWLARIALDDSVHRFIVFNAAGGVIADSREIEGVAVDRRADPLHGSRPFIGKLESGPAITIAPNILATRAHGANVLAVADVVMRRGGTAVAVARLELHLGEEAHRIDQAMLLLAVAISVTFALMLIIVAAALRHATRQRRRQRREVERLTQEDIVSGLPNRQLLEQVVARRARQTDEPTAVILMSIDRYARLAESEGAQTINMLVQSLAMRLKQRIRPDDTVVRLTTSEFVIVSPGTSADAAVATAMRLRAVANEIYSVGGRQFSLTVSAGIAMMPQHGRSEDALVRAARIARKRAVEQGAAVTVFSEEMADTERANAALEADLKQAIEVGDLHLAFQPQHDLATGAVVGFEALCRWRHHQWGDISPGRFIPIAEESDLIMPLGAWVLGEACRQAMSWPVGIKVGINLSPRQFAGSNVVRMVEDALRASGLPAERLELEITESTLLQENDIILAALLGLRRLGISVAMDDFGTGYSSLGYLAKFPFTKIKLDRSFVVDLETRREAFAIVSGVALIGRSLDMRITAEGVETDAQLAKLHEAGIHEIQGFLFGRPLEGDDVMRHLAHHDALPVRKAA